MDKLIISDKFTMNDLYKIREYNSLRWKDMTLEELQADLKPAVEYCTKRIKELREAKKGANINEPV